MMARKSNRHPADLIGEIDEEMDRLKETRAALREDLLKMGVGAHAGSEYVATVKSQPHSKFDQEAAKAELGAKWVKKHTTVKQVMHLSVTPLAEEGA